MPSGRGRLVTLNQPATGHPEQRGAVQLIGNYDPGRTAHRPAWAVHTAASLAGLIANYSNRRATINFGDPPNTVTAGYVDGVRPVVQQRLPG
jgi:hypothetical protein